MDHLLPWKSWTDFFASIVAMLLIVVGPIVRLFNRVSQLETRMVDQEKLAGIDAVHRLDIRLTGIETDIKWVREALSANKGSFMRTDRKESA